MMNNNGLALAIIAVFIHIFNRAAISLGVTDTSQLIVNIPTDNPSTVNLVSYIWSSTSSFFQIMTFQTTLPAGINGVIVTFIGIYGLWLILTLIRGGAR